MIMLYIFPSRELRIEDDVGSRPSIGVGSGPLTKVTTLGFLFFAACALPPTASMSTIIITIHLPEFAVILNRKAVAGRRFLLSPLSSSVALL